MARGNSDARSNGPTLARRASSRIITAATTPDRPELNHPHLHNWQLDVLVVWERLGPCVYGAAVGLAIIWTLKRLRARRA